MNEGNYRTRFEIDKVGTGGKTARVNLTLYPIIKSDIAKIAAVRRTSFNHLVNKILSEYADNHADEIAAYDRFFGK